MRHTKTIRGRHMVSKKEQIEQLKAKLNRAQAEAEHQAWLHACALRNIEARKARESARMKRDHAEQQRKRHEAEREDKRKRRQELSDGMLRLKDATEWAIVSDDKGKVLELTVPLTSDIEPIVHGVLTKKDDRQATINGQSATHSISDKVNDLVRRMKMAECGIIPHTFIAGGL